MDLGLLGQVAVVTGASRGIGCAIAKSLAREGVQLCLVARGHKNLTETATELRSQGHRVVEVAADVTTAAGATAVVEAAQTHFGRIDILINNVGGSLGTGRFSEVPSPDYEKVFDANFRSAVEMSRLVLPLMRQAHAGVLVNIASICGFELCASAPYMAAKAALIAMGKELATSAAPDGIRVVTVSPGSILFEGGSWDKRRQQNPTGFQRMLDADLPFGRLGTPEEVAEVVTFLASRRASWVAGANVVVDGGQSRSIR